ncbi:MAG: heparinase II/III family protein [Alphaproteobacteria bacterium]|nr:heparinase II/III family protein [Alphaproteobacteria bacterium]MDE1985415.1 heparinase II/III family protein [Alphaproteobacteria bacterium]MDE2161958.1 heparinase II/III family protein [Alphaproteobacteria bacterium]MDE2264914.1 heparinase II/III family protein [Alphaproteobacteria bacterium]
MAASSAHRPRLPLSLFFEAAAVAFWRAGVGLRRWRRSTWLYRRFLKGTLADRIAFHPYDALPRRLEDADALLRGKFRFNGETVEVADRSIFDLPAPSREWAEALHGFAWLPPLSAAGGEPARTLATNLISQWLKRHGKYTEPAWLPHVMARRLVHIFGHGRFILSNSDMLWRSKVFVTLREQSRMLARIADEAPDGLPRFEAAAALALSGACLLDSPRRLEAGLARLGEEIARQILPDGGHISRSPEALVHAYRYVVMVMDALAATGHDAPQTLRSAHDRMAPMIRFFRHGDGALALFNGGSEGDARMISGLLSRDEVRGQPFSHARHSGYQRLAAARTLALLDCGPPPPSIFAANAHAGSLAFELSAAAQRIVVNCGSATSSGQRNWERALRTTAAHSTLTLEDTSTATVLADGWMRNLLGARLYGGGTAVDVRRTDTPNGVSIEARHDGYLHAFGIIHERVLTMSPQGLALTGADRLLPQKGHGTKSLSFAVRFHIHPDVRVSTSQSGDVILKLPSGEGWRFRSGAPVSIEESVYLGGDTVRRCEQLVLTGSVKNTQAEVAWIFEQIGAA